MTLVKYTSIEDHLIFTTVFGMHHDVTLNIKINWLGKTKISAEGTTILSIN